jgi:5-methyltetrahydrofolate--homocysteine methyltransferase
MSSTSFLAALQSGRVLVSDGATGTILQRQGLPKGMPSDQWVLENPEQVVALHRRFIEAGSDVILTDTFGGTPLRLVHTGISASAAELNRRAVELAKTATAGTEVWVAGSIGPTGELLQPYGTLAEADAEAAFKQQAQALVAGGVDLIVIETQFDLTEAKAALRAVRAVTDLPVVCSFSYDRGTRTMMGVKPAQMAAELEGLGVNVLGINCGRSLADNQKALGELRQATNLPIWFKPNAGLPRTTESGDSEYDVTPADMAAQVPGWIEAGAQVIGGCCGTSPEHLAAMATVVHGTQADR